MKFAALSISPLRLDRLMLWSRLWLLRLAHQIVQAAGVWAPLDRAVQRSLAPKIAKLGKFILALIVLKAGLRARHAYAAQRKKTGLPYGPSPRAAKHHARRLFGARLRKLHSHKIDLRAQIAALLTVLQNADTHIARFARRLARGLNRREGGVASDAFEAETLYFTPCQGFDAANTS